VSLANGVVSNSAQDAPYDTAADADIIWPDGGRALPWASDGHGNIIVAEPQSLTDGISNAKHDDLALSALAPPSGHDGGDVFSFLGSLGTSNFPPGDGNGLKPHWAAGLAEREPASAAKAEQPLSAPAGWGGLPSVPAASAAQSSLAATEPNSASTSHAAALALPNQTEQRQSSSAGCPLLSSKASLPCSSSLVLLQTDMLLSPRLGLLC